MNILYLGPKNSYHYHAVKQHFSQKNKSGNNYQYIPCKTFADIFDEVKNNPQSYGIVALNNTLAGDIKENILRLEEMKDTIISIDTTVLKIELTLIGLKNSSLNEIKSAHSHPKALAESSIFLDKYSIKGIEVNSTSLGCDKIISENNPIQAAIGHISLTDHPSTKILAQNIDNNPENHTTFAIIKRRNAQE